MPDAVPITIEAIENEAVSRATHQGDLEANDAKNCTRNEIGIKLCVYEA